MGAILFAMGCMGRKLRRDGVLNLATKVPLVLLKDGKGGQKRDMYGIGKMKRGRPC